MLCTEQVDQQKQPWSSAGARRALPSAACHFYRHSRCSVTCPFTPQSLPTSVCLVSVFLMEYIVFHSADVPEFMPSHHVPGPGVQPSAKAPTRQCAVGQCRCHGRESREGDAGLAGPGRRHSCLCRTVRPSARQVLRAPGSSKCKVPEVGAQCLGQGGGCKGDSRRQLEASLSC